VSASRLSAWLPVLAWAAVIFALSSIPHLGTGLGTWDTILRKGAHVTEYAIFGLLLARAIGREMPAFLLGGRLRDHGRDPPAFRHRPAFLTNRRRNRLHRRPDRGSRLRPRPAVGALAGRRIGRVPERKPLEDRQLDAVLERLDKLVDEIHVLNRRLDHAEGLRPCRA